MMRCLIRLPQPIRLDESEPWILSPAGYICMKGRELGIAGCRVHLRDFPVSCLSTRDLLTNTAHAMHYSPRDL